MQEPAEPRTMPHQPSVAGEWLKPGRFALLLVALLLAAFPQVLLELHTFVVRDFGFFAYPLAHYQRECFWRGELPLWNPYNNCGVPSLAQWNTMPLYPPALVYLVLPLDWSLSFFCLLHLFFAGLGMYFLAHRWTGNRLAASVAGVIFAFNGFSLNLLMWPSHIATLSWMPWVVLTVEQGWRQGGRKLIVAALAGAMQMLAGGPETILFTWLLLLALWLMECVSPRQGEPLQLTADPPVGSEAPRPSRARLWRFPLMVLLVAGLAAAQLLPFLDLAAHSERQAGYADTRWSLPGWGWANFLVPMVFGSTWNKGIFFQHGQAWTSSYYLGVGALLLASLAVWTVRQRRVWLLAAAAGVAFVLALGDQTPVSHWLRQVIPHLSLITYPVKFVAVIVFAAPLLAAFGLTRLQSAPPEEKWHSDKRLLFLGVVLLALIAAILVWAWRHPFPSDDVPAAIRNGLGRIGFLAVSVALLWGLARGMLLARYAPLLVLLVLWLDVWTHAPPQNPAVPGSVYAPGLAATRLAMKPQPELGTSRAMVTPAADLKFMQFILNDFKDNFLVKRLGYYADCNLLDAVPKVNGFFSLYPRESGDLVSALYSSTNATFPHLLDFLSVSQITAPGQFFEWSPRASFLPLVTAGQRPVFLDDTNTLLGLFDPAFDGAKLVLLPPEARQVVSVTNQTRARVVAQRFTSQQVDVEVLAAEPSFVVISQTYYHFWHAYVDGQPTPLLRANYAFQAVQVPAGSHRLRLAYVDHALHTGAFLSGLTLATCLAVWARARRPTPHA
jgi:hypothetical protein